MKKKRSVEETTTAYNKAETLIKNGASISNACKQVGLGIGTFYNRRNPKRKTASKAIRRKPALIVQDLPQAGLHSPFFMVFGTPAMLLQFAKEMQ